MKELFDHWGEVKGGLDGKEPFIFLDYDGTLTPIVATPDMAVLAESMRDVLRRLAAKHNIFIVSGRATDDVRGKVKIGDIFYVGSHGFEIVRPDGTVQINEQAKAVRPVIDRVFEQLDDRLSLVKGALVEHVKYTISAHYRLVSEEDLPKVRQAVDEVLKTNTNLRMTNGKKVFEIRPKIDWDKGKAVEWILKFLKFDPDKNAVIYIGDDTTDEDAFGVIEDIGFGILVAEEPRPTKARYLIHNTDEVSRTLVTLSEL